MWLIVTHSSWCGQNIITLIVVVNLYSKSLSLSSFVFHFFVVVIVELSAKGFKFGYGVVFLAVHTICLKNRYFYSSSVFLVWMLCSVLKRHYFSFYRFRVL